MLFGRPLDFSLAAHLTICEVRAMNLLHRTIPLSLVFALFACGGSAPPPKDPNGASDSGKTADADGPTATTDEEHKSFMTECTETPAMKDYCSCSWDTLAKMTTAEERTDLANPNTKKALMALPKQCGSKLPKDMVKSNFVKTCASSPLMTAYCACSYEFLDSKGLVQGTAEDAAKVEGELKVACSKELQEVSKAAFMQGCGESQTAAVCQCTFAALEKKYGKDKLHTFLETGGADAKKAAQSAAKTCGAK
jgi:hypothetical protein